MHKSCISVACLSQIAVQSKFSRSGRRLYPEAYFSKLGPASMMVENFVWTLDAASGFILWSFVASADMNHC